MIKKLKRYFSDVLSELSTAVSTLCIISGQLTDLTQAVNRRNEHQERIASAVESLRDMQRAQLSGTHPHLVR